VNWSWLRERSADAPIEDIMPVERRTVDLSGHDDLPTPIGMMQFAPLRPARGPMFSARTRAGDDPAGSTAPAFSEEELHGPPRRRVGRVGAPGREP
jgi:hypothetical protein